MKVSNYNNNNIQFGAIFNLKKTTHDVSEVIIDAVAKSTVPAEAEKIAKKFQVGGGSLPVYIPDENMQKLLNKLQFISREAIVEHLTRID